MKLKKAFFSLVAAILVLSCAYGIFIDYKTAFAYTTLDARYEYNATGASALASYGNNWSAQTFTPTTSHTVTTVYIKKQTVGDPGTKTIAIKATAAGLPTGADLCSGTLVVGTGWYSADLGAGTALTAGTMYAVVLYCSAGSMPLNYEAWFYHTSSVYAGGTYCTSTDGGSSWSSDANKDFVFEEWGTGAYYSGDEWTANAAATTLPHIGKLSSSTIVMAYKDSDNKGRAIYGVINSSGITFGTDYTFLDSTVTSISGVVGLSATQFIVMYDNKIKIGTVTVADKSIAYSVAIDYPSTFETTLAATTTGGATRLTDTTFAITYPEEDGANDKCAVAVGTVTGEGTGISWGAVVTSGTVCTRSFIDALSTTALAIGYSGGSSNTYGLAGSISGTTITLGSGTSMGNGGAGGSIKALSSTKFVLAYERGSDGFKAVVGDVTGTSVVYGSEYEFQDVYAGYSSLDLTKVSATEFALVYRSSVTFDGVNLGFTALGTVTGTTIAYGNEYVFNVAATTLSPCNASVIAVDSSTWVIGYVDSDTYAKAIVVRTQTFPIWEPIVTTDAASGITDDDATLNGTLDYDGEASCEYRFGVTTIQGGPYYYTDWSVGAALETTDTFDTTLTDELWAGQTFYYVAECDNEYYTGTGDEEDFTTTGVYSPDDAPVIVTGIAGNVTTATATLYGTVTDLGDYATIYGYIQYGLTSSYGYNTTEQEITATGEYHADIVGLTPGTVYHYRAIARYHTYAFAYGSDLTFITSGSSSSIPVVNTLAATGVTTTTATLNGALTTLGLYSNVYVDFEYDTDITDSSYEWSTPWQTFTTASSFSSTIGALELYEVYHFRARCLYGEGSYAYGSDLTFTTDESGIPPIPPDSLSGGSAVEQLPDNIVPIWGQNMQDVSTQTSNPFYEPVNTVAPYTGFDTDQLFFWFAVAITLGVAIGGILSFRGHLLVSGILTIATMGFFVAWGIFPYYLMILGGAYLIASLVAERQPSL